MGKKPDRRIERTRKLLLDAFRDLVLEYGFSRLTVGDIIERANVGRSTFYEHFENKDDILQRSIAPLFDVLAKTVDDAAVSAQLVHIVAHFRQNARDTGVVFAGRSGRILANFLGELIQSRLESRKQANGSYAVIPLSLAARQLAHAQLALINAWIGTSDGCTPEAVAAALARSTYAAARAIRSAPNTIATPSVR